MQTKENTLTNDTSMRDTTHENKRNIIVGIGEEVT